MAGAKVMELSSKGENNQSERARILQVAALMGAQH
jgi:hypothetical protein